MAANKIVDSLRVGKGYGGGTICLVNVHVSIFFFSAAVSDLRLRFIWKANSRAPLQIVSRGFALLIFYYSICKRVGGDNKTPRPGAVKSSDVSVSLLPERERERDRTLPDFRPEGRAQNLFSRQQQIRIIAVCPPTVTATLNLL